MAKQARLPVNSVVCGDAFEVLPTFPKESIDMIMFSPPYWGLRDYKNVPRVFGGSACQHEWGTKQVTLRYSGGVHGKTGQHSSDKTHFEASNNFCLKCGAWKGNFGLEPYPQMFIDHMVQLCVLLKRVLKKSGSMYLNLGDTYYGSGKGRGTKTPSKNLPYDECHPFVQQTESSNWLQAKQKLMMPSRVAIALQEDGWILRNDVIWHKPNHMPSSVKDRLTSSYEHIFHFVKKRKYYYDLDAIRQPHKEGVTRWGGQRMQVPKKQKQQQGLSRALLNEERDWRNPRGKNPSDVVTEEKLSRGPTKHDVAVGRTGNVAYTDPLHTKEYNLSGKNPADVIKIGSHHGSSLTKGRATHYEKQLIETHALGKNPTDVLKLDSAACPMGPQRWEREGTNRVEARFHASGKNPADVINYHDLDYKGDKVRTDGEGPARFSRLSLGLSNPKHVMGKNPGDFWSINTKPYKEAHFAVYPEAICELPIKSSCPSQICKACGKPRTRITGHACAECGAFIKWQAKSCLKCGFVNDWKSKRKVVPEKLATKWHEPGRVVPLQKKMTIHTKSFGFSDCGCNIGFEAGIVLDPMCGAGTTLLAAHKLGRKWIGIELNPSYVEMAKRRLERECSRWLSDFKEGSKP